MTTASAGAGLDQPAHEGLAAGEFVQGDELVRLVRLIDQAGAAYHRRETRALEAPGLGGVGHGDRGIAAGQPQGQLLGLLTWIGREPRH